MKLPAAIVLVALGTASAAADDARVALMGVGATACAGYSEEYRRNPTGADPVFFSWAQGFMSGLNLIRIERKQPLYDLGAMPVPEQIARLRQLCEQKPLVPYAYAVQDLMKTFPEIPPPN